MSHQSRNPVCTWPAEPRTREEGHLVLFVPDFTYFEVNGLYTRAVVRALSEVTTSPSSELVPIYLTYSRGGKLRSMASSLIHDGRWAAAPTLNHYSGRQTFQARPGDRILVSFQFTWPVVRRLVRNLGQAETFVIVHNIESEFRRRRKSTHAVNRLVPAIEKWNIQGLRRLDREMGECHVACVSYNDMETLRARRIPCKSLQFVGWTTLLEDSDLRSANHALAAGPRAVKRTLIFMSNGRNPDNRAGLDWFLGKISLLLPEPGTWKLRLVGPGWGDFSVTSPVSVERVGFVERVSGLLAKGMVAINPDVSGVGIKTKLLDYAAMGLPTVSTILGAQGLPPAARANLVLGDEPAEWASLLAELQDPSRWAQCSHRMSEFASGYATREAFVKRLCSFLSHQENDGRPELREAVPPTPALDPAP